MTSKVRYAGALRTEAVHLKSGEQILTDAPEDNMGKGAAFSPTDLVATALASCMLTIMGIVARRYELALEGTECAVEKIMESNPRRIGEIKITMQFPKDSRFSDQQKQLLENAALTCPVLESLHPELKKTVHFMW